jgi:acyl dehydratase
MIGKTIAELNPGDRAEITRVVEDGDIAAFVDAVGDYNPVHSDRAYAATTPFKQPIAPGHLHGRADLGRHRHPAARPGRHLPVAVLKFVKPVKSGDTITARAEIIEVMQERNRIRIQTVCVNQHGEEVLSGEAWVMPSRVRVVYESKPHATAAMTALALQPFAWAAQAMSLWGSLSLAMLGRR